MSRSSVRTLWHSGISQPCSSAWCNSGSWNAGPPFFSVIAIPPAKSSRCSTQSGSFHAFRGCNCASSFLLRTAQWPSVSPGASVNCRLVAFSSISGHVFSLLLLMVSSAFSQLRRHQTELATVSNPLAFLRPIPRAIDVAAPHIDRLRVQGTVRPCSGTPSSLPSRLRLPQPPPPLIVCVALFCALECPPHDCGACTL